MSKKTVEARFDGLQATARKIEAMARAGGDAMVSGLRVIGESIKTDVGTPRSGAGVPKDEGTLMTSLRVEGPDRHGAVELTAGGAAAPYALYQHEVTDLHHELGEARYWIRGLERFEGGGGPAKALEEMLDAAVKAGKTAG